MRIQDNKRRQFIKALGAAAGFTVAGGFGLSQASTPFRSSVKKITKTPSRRLEDYPHIIDAIPSRDMKHYFHLIVDACADPKNDYLSKIPFLIELEVAKIWNESHFEWDAISSAGAVGLQQLMEPAAREFGLTVAESYEIMQLNSSISSYSELRSAIAEKRAQLYGLAECGTGNLSGKNIEKINTLRSELLELTEKKSEAFTNLRSAKKAYVDKIHSMSEQERGKTDARFVPELLIPAGVKHIVRDITECQRVFGGPVEMNVWRGIAAYNAGLNSAKTWDGFPFIEETVLYTRNVVYDLTRALELEYAYSVKDPAVAAETRKRFGLKNPYFVYRVKKGDNFYTIVRKQLMERYDIPFAEAVHLIRDSRGKKIVPEEMSIILPDQIFRIYIPG
ncbi:MAG: transglycosylase SLT domain-containing protein [Syntrophales bacterium]|jgi:hypothetical protein|nr:transglycosylase SLT domain-containing protein [Syntrophales bacterium]MDY0044584.1 transglycosylase SLT domain-containing protein [Syntrophales bacterium]